VNAFLSSRFSLLIILSALSLVAAAQTLEGRLGNASGPGWQSSWLSLADDQSFKKGDGLIITLDGDAEYVAVRLLPTTADPDSPDGLLGESEKVPADRVLIVTLTRDHPTVEQISVHAGRAAWDVELGEYNGKVLIVSVDRQRPPQRVKAEHQREKAERQREEAERQREEAEHQPEKEERQPEEEEPQRQ